MADTNFAMEQVKRVDKEVNAMFLLQNIFK